MNISHDSGEIICSLEVSVSIKLFYKEQSFWVAVLVSFVLLWQNNRDKQLKRKKDLFWLTVSVHASWFCCFGACSGTGHHGEQHMVGQSCSPHGGQEAEERVRRRPQNTLQGHTACDLTSFNQVPPAEVVTTSQQCHWLGIKPFNTWAFGGHLRYKP